MKSVVSRHAGFVVATGCALILTLLVTERAYGQLPDAQDKLAALKQSIQASAAALRQYEWVETLVISRKGEEKSRKQSRCYYGADGGLQKTVVTEEGGGGRKKRGVRGRVVKNKTEDMKEYIAQAMALVKQYVPPDPQKIQTAKDAGRTTLSVHDNATRIRLGIPDYLKAGDTLSLDIDPNNDRLLGISVSTYLDDREDAVTLDVTFRTLEDGTSYPSQIVLDGKSEEIKISISNSGYRKSG
jgi:hypothetical protein